MSAAALFFLLTLSALCGSAVVSGILRGPTNVSLTSYNLDLVLKWDPPEGAPSGLVYTSEYKTKRLPYKVGCGSTSTLQCDFSRLENASIYEYASYRGRVRAELGAERSDWVESGEISLDRDTIIGPPTIFLVPYGDSIEVNIKDPDFAFSTLKNVYGSHSYNITYWKAGHQEEAESTGNEQQNPMILSNLDPMTNYCFQVQIKTRANAKPSEPSRPVCERTTNKEEVPWVAAVVTFIIMVMAVALVVVVVIYRENIQHFLCPKDALPQHFKEPPKSAMYMAMRNSHPPKEPYDPVSIVTDGGSVADEKCPLQEAGNDGGEERGMKD